MMQSPFVPWPNLTLTFDHRAIDGAGQTASWPVLSRNWKTWTSPYFRASIRPQPYSPRVSYEKNRRSFPEEIIAERVHDILVELGENPDRDGLKRTPQRVKPV
jgi:hypothetical protein